MGAGEIHACEPKADDRAGVFRRGALIWLSCAIVEKSDCKINFARAVRLGFDGFKRSEKLKSFSFAHNWRSSDAMADSQLVGVLS